MRRPVQVPGWLAICLLAVIGANLVAGTATNITIDLMRSNSEFARRVRDHDLQYLSLWRCIVYPVCIGIAIAYLWPLITYFRCGAAEAPSPEVQRRAVSAPLVIAAVGYTGWLSGLILFPALTLWRFGNWAPELMSQQVLSPAVNGFLAAATSYLLVDWVFRTRVVPRVFPDGGVANVRGALTLNVRERLALFLVAVAFLPLFTVLGLVRAASAHLAEGMPVEGVMSMLVRATEGTFWVYQGLAAVLTLLLARTFTRPLADVAVALRRVRTGDLGGHVQVSSGDEVGVLEEGVNDMIATLRDRERILQTFGRVVEPVVRDRLLAGDLRAEGEVRTASVLFCDLRDFTTYAEHTPPRELVQTLNQFFTTMTAWARECDGFVDKFVGDGLLVVFGLFADDPLHGSATGAAAALRCALGMRERLVRLNAERTAGGRPPLAMKVGVHTGPVVAGTIGAADRHEYTVIGDTVNVAARLEELCREHGCDLMVSAATWDLARAGGLVVPAATAAAVTVRGRDQVVQVYRVG